MGVERPRRAQRSSAPEDDVLRPDATGYTAVLDLHRARSAAQDQLMACQQGTEPAQAGHDRQQGHAWVGRARSVSTQRHASYHEHRLKNIGTCRAGADDNASGHAPADYVPVSARSVQRLSAEGSMQGERRSTKDAATLDTMGTMGSFFALPPFSGTGASPEQQLAARALQQESVRHTNSRDGEQLATAASRPPSQTPAQAHRRSSGSTDGQAQRQPQQASSSTHHKLAPQHQHVASPACQPTPAGIDSSAARRRCSHGASAATPMSAKLPNTAHTRPSHALLSQLQASLLEGSSRSTTDTHSSSAALTGNSGLQQPQPASAEPHAPAGFAVTPESAQRATLRAHPLLFQGSLTSNPSATATPPQPRCSDECAATTRISIGHLARVFSQPGSLAAPQPSGTYVAPPEQDLAAAPRSLENNVATSAFSPSELLADTRRLGSYSQKLAHKESQPASLMASQAQPHALQEKSEDVDSEIGTAVAVCSKPLL